MRKCLSRKIFTILLSWTFLRCWLHKLVIQNTFCTFQIHTPFLPKPNVINKPIYELSNANYELSDSSCGLARVRFIFIWWMHFQTWNVMLYNFKFKFGIVKCEYYGGNCLSVCKSKMISEIAFLGISSFILSVFYFNAIWIQLSIIVFWYM